MFVLKKKRRSNGWRENGLSLDVCIEKWRIFSPNKFYLKFPDKVLKLPFLLRGRRRALETQSIMIREGGYVYMVKSGESLKKRYCQR